LLLAVADGTLVTRFPRARPEPRVVPNANPEAAGLFVAAGVAGAGEALTVSAGATEGSPEVSDADMTYVFVVLGARQVWQRRNGRTRGVQKKVHSTPADCSNIRQITCFGNPYLFLCRSAFAQCRCRNPSLLPVRPLPTHDGMDKLEEIFQMQAALNARIGVNLPPPNDEEKTKWILNYTRAMQQETAELIDSVPWKWWAKYQKFDEQNAKVEVVDLFHFLVSLAQTLGMTSDDVYQAYLKKNQVNHARQESGYVKKDESDSRHI
jgi:dimeric dUTPase (all-alpha-NTP-PPase superfamily)